MSTPFRHPPLVLSAVEVRFPELLPSVLRDARRELHSAMKPYLPISDTVTHTTFEIDVDNNLPKPRIEQRRFPRFKSRDSAMAMVFQDSAAVFETTVYAGYEAFRPMVNTLVNVVHDFLTPDGVTRIGLRYIDEIRLPHVQGMPGDWNTYIDDHLLAAVQPEFLPEGITAQTWQGVVTYITGDSQSLTLRYGPATGYAVNPMADGARRSDPPPPGPFFLLDSDSAWSASAEVPEFSPENIMAIVDDIHRPATAIFNAACTDSLRRVFNED